MTSVTGETGMRPETAVLPSGFSRPSLDTFADPVFVLAPPLGLALYVSAALGQHPELCDLPETHLFLSETLRAW
jgi:hypothetical protein